MKVAHIAPPWLAVPPKNYGGTEAVLYNLVEEQVAQGHDVTLLAPGDAKTSAKLVSFFPRSLIEAGVPWQAHLKAYYHYHKAFEHVKYHHYDILHTHLSSSADMYMFPLAHMMEMKTPMITTLHSRFPFDRVQSWIGDADDYYLEWIREVPLIAISESARKEVPHHLNFAGIVHHGLPMTTYYPTVEQPEDFLFWLGRFVPDKGPHHAIQVARATGMPLVMAGIVDKHLPEATRYFENEIKPYIDDKQIRYIGPVNLRQKIHWLSRAKAFLNPIEWEEPFGMVIIEAMAVGCPVISFARGAASELIIHNKTGFLVHDEQEMQRHVSKIDTLDRKVVRAHVEHNFSVRAMAEKYTRHYKSAIASSVIGSSFPRITAKIPIISPSTTPLPLVAPAKTDGTVGGPYHQPLRQPPPAAEAEPLI